MVPIIQEAEWAPGLVGTGAENMAPTGFRSPDLPVRSQSLYRLLYTAPVNYYRLPEMERNSRQVTVDLPTSDFIEICQDILVST